MDTTRKTVLVESKHQHPCWLWIRVWYVEFCVHFCPFRGWLDPLRKCTISNSCTNPPRSGEHKWFVLSLNESTQGGVGWFGGAERVLRVVKLISGWCDGNFHGTFKVANVSEFPPIREIREIRENFHGTFKLQMYWNIVVQLSCFETFQLFPVPASGVNLTNGSKTFQPLRVREESTRSNPPATKWIQGWLPIISAPQIWLRNIWQSLLHPIWVIVLNEEKTSAWNRHMYLVCRLEDLCFGVIVTETYGDGKFWLSKKNQTETSKL